MNDLCATREMTVEEAVQTIKNNTIYLMMGRSTHKEYDANRFIASINTLINYVEEQEIERKKKAIDTLEGLIEDYSYSSIFDSAIWRDDFDIYFNINLLNTFNYNKYNLIHLII